MTTNNSSLFTPSEEARPLVRQNANNKLSAGSTTAIVLGTLAAAAIVGTMVGLLVSYFMDKNKRHDKPGRSHPNWIAFDYSKSADLDSNSFNYMVYAFNSSSLNAVPTVPSDSFVLRFLGDPTTCGGNYQEPVIVFPVSPPKVTGLYIVIVKNYINGSSDNCQAFESIDPEATFISNIDPNAAKITTDLLKNIISTRPPLSLIFSWGDATNILTNNSVVSTLKQLGSYSISNTSSYKQGSAYALAYQPGAPHTQTEDVLTQDQIAVLEPISPIQKP